MVNLVVVEKDKYSFFKGKEKIVSVVSPDIDKASLEAYRRNPKQIELDVYDIEELADGKIKVTMERLEELIDNSIFLHEHVLKGMTREEWFESQE